jgi:O-antigen/teichoic acid export membrane protein
MYLMKLNHFRWGVLKVDWNFLTRERRKEIGRYTMFMTVTVLAGNVPFFNSLFLGAKAGLALTGVYTIAFYIANVVEVPYRSLGAISRPVVAAAVKENNWGEVNRLVRQVSLHQLLVSSAIFLVIWINLDTLYAFIPNGASYAGGAGVVLMMGMAKAFNSSFSIGTDVLNFSRYYSRSLLFMAILTVSAILLNPLLIELWGITGAASATLFSYLLYYTLLLGYIYWRTRVSLFSAAQLKVVVLTAAGFALNLLWGSVVTPLFDGSKSAMLLDAALKTTVLVALLAATTYAWKVSPTVNSMIDKLLKKDVR